MTGPLEAGAGLPLGPLVDAGPAGRPSTTLLQGRFGRLEKLEPTQHGYQLWEAVNGHDEIWTYLPSYGPFPGGAQFFEFLEWLTGRTRLEHDPFSYAIVDLAGRALGIVTLKEIRPAMRVIEIGHLVYSPTLQRTPLASEAHYLLSRYVFDTLGYRRYEWNCDALNAASRRAALRLGFTFEGIFRQHRIAKGRNRDTAWYSMLDSEWPARKAAFERWLAPDNFDADGRQLTRLNELMNPTAGEPSSAFDHF
jgi:RimJ/RimL family protein N-acetyltransferase